MSRRHIRISKVFLFVVLGVEESLAYAPLTKRKIREFQTSRKPVVQLSSYVRSDDANSRTRRRYLCDGYIEKFDRINGIGTGLASRLSSGDSQHEDFEPSINNGVFEEDSMKIQRSPENNDDDSDEPSIFQRMFDEVPFIHLFFSDGRKKLPPMQVDDFGVMLYDIFLIVNLSLSISFWVTHRVDFGYISYAFNEGCLFSILWIASGLYHGSFLYSAMDGHYPLDDEQSRGGPKAAAALAFNTYINAINLRLISALVGAWIQHRKVGEGSPMEELIPLEIGCGLVLMTMWRALHSQVTPRTR